jgi:NTP pyrophosphatase (non-canonical NTP hydrolase)
MLTMGERGDRLGWLREANEARQKEWDQDNRIDLAYRACELAGEAGEAANVCKKIERERRGIRGSRASLQDLADELADVVICADLIAMHEGIDLGEAVARKFNATSAENGLATRIASPPPRSGASLPDGGG